MNIHSVFLLSNQLMCSVITDILNQYFSNNNNHCLSATDNKLNIRCNSYGSQWCAQQQNQVTNCRGARYFIRMQIILRLEPCISCSVIQFLVTHILHYLPVVMYVNLQCFHLYYTNRPKHSGDTVRWMDSSGYRVHSQF